MSNDLLTQLADYGHYHREVQAPISPEDIGVPLVRFEPHRGPWTRWAAPTAAVAAALLVPLVWLATQSNVRDTGTMVPPAAVPEGAPAPGSIVPFVATAPKWFGEPVASQRPAGDRTGRWVSTAIGKSAGEGQVSSPIVAAVTSGTLSALADSEEVVVNGETLRSVVFGDWQALATVGEPTVVVSGAVAQELLAEVVSAATVVSAQTESVMLTRLPAGYAELVAPQQHAEDVPARRTLTNAEGDTSVNEISDWVQPELAAAASGADYERVDINGTPGWTGRTEFNSYGPLTFLIWSPQVGVVFEIVTTNETRTIEQLIELATATDALSATEWDVRLGN